jgi:hypothetical protein
VKHDPGDGLVVVHQHDIDSLNLGPGRVPSHRQHPIAAGGLRPLQDLVVVAPQ